MRRPGGPLLLVCAALIVAGCGGGETGPSSPKSPRPVEKDANDDRGKSEREDAPSVDPVPVLPRTAMSATSEGAAAFVAHWFDLVNYAYSSGDTGPLGGASHDDCGTCASVSQQVRDRYEAGGSIEGGSISVLSAEATPLDDVGVSLVSVVYSQEPIVERAPDGKAAIEGAGEEKSVVAFYAQYQSERWVAFEVVDE